MSWYDDLDRRTFLRKLGLAGLAAGAAGFGCRDDGTAGIDASDAGRAADTLLDGRGSDSALSDVADTLETGDTADAVDAAMQSALTKPPFTQVTGPKSLRIRFETATDTPLPVRLEPLNAMGGMGAGVEKQPMTATRKIDFEWPIDPTKSLPVEHRDLPGTYTVQEATFEGLKPGARYRWVVDLGHGDELTGRARVPPPSDAAFRLGWIADTMHPQSGKTGPLLEDQSPDIILHGGDIQYQSNPLDTFNGMFQTFTGPMQTAPMHFCVGNHESEGQNEFELFFERLFSARDSVGDDGMGQPTDFHAFTYGGVRFILANSEADFDDGADQYKWLEAELKAAAMDPAVRFPVVAFHRPYFTFSRSSPSFATRDVFHPLFRDHDVPLVLTGHNHCYERFEADGVTYVVDGGGGALSYLPNDNRSKVLMERPKDADRRKATARGYGVTTVDVKADGTMELERVNVDGSVGDSVTLG